MRWLAGKIRTMTKVDRGGRFSSATALFFPPSVRWGGWGAALVSATQVGGLDAFRGFVGDGFAAQVRVEVGVGDTQFVLVEPAGLAVQ